MYDDLRIYRVVSIAISTLVLPDVLVRALSPAAAVNIVHDAFVKRVRRNKDSPPIVRYRVFEFVLPDGEGVLSEISKPVEEFAVKKRKIVDTASLDDS